MQNLKFRIILDFWTRQLESYSHLPLERVYELHEKKVIDHVRAYWSKQLDKTNWAEGIDVFPSANMPNSKLWVYVLEFWLIRQ